MAPNDLIRITREIKDRLVAAIDAPPPDLAEVIITTGMVPLWYAPALFCGVPGKPELLPPQDALSAVQLLRCLERWAGLITNAILMRPLPPRGLGLLPRDPYGGSILADHEPVTVDCVIPWADLEKWAMRAHGVSAGYPPPQEDPQAPDVHALESRLTDALEEIERLSRELADERKTLDPRHRKTLLTVIGALLPVAKITPDLTPFGVAAVINAQLRSMGQPERKPDTLAPIISAARALANELIE